MPSTPSSAATVSGVVCDLFLLAASLCAASSRLAFGWAPTPTPASGWFRKTLQVTATRRDRSLVDLRAESPRACRPTTAPAAITITAETATTTRRVSLDPAASASAVTTTKIVTMLDCEYENQRAAKASASTGAATASLIRPSRYAETTTAVPSARYRPKRLGSLKTELTRKYDVNALSTSRFGA